jgi:pyruvate, orthophosphate dikinase
LVRTRFGAHASPAVGYGKVASIGVASGAIALDPAAIDRVGRDAVPVILVRQDTTTEDVEGIARATGILTATGARTSHAAVVARQLGKVCVVGCADLSIDLENRRCRIGTNAFQEGDFLSLDGNDGAIYAGRLPIIAEQPTEALARLAAWRSKAA